MALLNIVLSSFFLTEQTITKQNLWIAIALFAFFSLLNVKNVDKVEDNIGKLFLMYFIISPVSDILEYASWIILGK